MKNLLNLVRMDFFMLRAYGKNIIMLFAIIVFFSLNSAFNSVIGGIVGAYASIIGTYPFSISDKYDIDLLYATLPVKRSMVVIGRYLFGLSVVLLFLLVPLLSSVARAAMGGGAVQMEEVIGGVLTVIIITSLMLSIQMPIFFKLGYNKSKALAYLPGLLAFGAIAGGAALSKNTGMDFGFLDNISLPGLLVGVVVIGVVIFLVSMVASVRFYERRDF